MKTYFFIFGEAAQDVYFANGFDALLKEVKNGKIDNDLHKFRNDEHPGKLLRKFEGNTGFISLAAYEYYALERLSGVK